MELDPRLAERYEPIRVLGGGGQACVVLARERATGAEVALKVLRVGQSASERERFLREARALSHLVHPHLVGYVDLIRDVEPPVLVMEAVRGKDLLRVLGRHGALGTPATRELGAALASALAMLHGKGYIHRDVKPENVLVAPGRGPVLVDLGMVVSDEMTRHTRTGLVVGTVAYLAPEIFGGAGSSTASDVFALGQVLYECLRAEPAFTIPGLVMPSAGGQLPQGPGRVLLQELGPVVARALAPEPRDRPAADELERALAATGGDTLEVTTQELLAGLDGASDLPGTRLTPGPGTDGTGGAPRRKGPWLLAFLAVALASALIPTGAPRPLPSLRLEPDPLGVVARWDGSQGARDLELLADESVVLNLRGGPGVQEARVELEDPRRFRVRRGGRMIPFGPEGVVAQDLGPASVPAPEALRWSLGPGGLELRVPAAPWTPGRVLFEHGDERWEVAAQARGDAAGFPVGRVLDGRVPLRARALAEVAADHWKRVGPPTWAALEAAPRALEVMSGSIFASDGPYLPEDQLLRPIEPPPRATRVEEVAATVSQRVEAHGPGPVAARYGERFFYLGCSGLFHGSFVYGYPLDGGPAMVHPLPPNHSWIPDYNLAPLEGGVGIRMATTARPEEGASWFVLRGGEPLVESDLGEGGFRPRAGPIPRPGGGALFLGASGRVRVAGPDGTLGPPQGTAFPWPFRFRRGAIERPGQVVALAGSWLRQPPREDFGFLVVDLAAARVLGAVGGLPALPRAHPVWIAEGPDAGLHVLVGDQVLHFRAGPMRSQMEGARGVLDLEDILRARGLGRTQVSDGPDHDDRIDAARTSVAQGPESAVFAFLDPATGPGGAPLGRQGDLAVSYRRWKAWVRGPGGSRVIELDDGPFPTHGNEDLSALVDLREDLGLAVVASETLRMRWVLELISLESPRVLMRWDLNPRFQTSSPRLRGDGIHLLNLGNYTVFPLPPGLTGDADQAPGR